MKANMSFKFIFSIIIIGIILVFGFYSISTLKKNTELKNNIELINSLKNNIEDMSYQNYGISKTIKIKLPKNTILCFINKSFTYNGNNQRLIKLSKITSTLSNENTVLLTNTDFKAYNIGKIKPKTVPLCINKSSEIILISQGKTVLIKQ